MRTVEQIKSDIRKLEQDLHSMKSERASSVPKDIKREIEALECEINKDVIYIKNVYNHLLDIRSSAEFSVRRDSDPDALSISKKVHLAFTMLVEYNKKLDVKVAQLHRLCDKRDAIVAVGFNIAKFESVLKELDNLKDELITAEIKTSPAADARERVLKELRQRQDENDRKLKVARICSEIDKLSEHAPTCTCGTKTRLQLNSTNKKVFWGCPNYADAKLSHNQPDCHNKKIADSYKSLKDRLLNLKKDSISPSAITLDEKERNALQHTVVELDGYPNILQID